MTASEFEYKKIQSSINHKDVGTPTGATHKCRMAGCNGIRITTKWSDGKLTHPCSKGLIVVNAKKGIYRIG
jgi:hypothetical protein